MRIKVAIDPRIAVALSVQARKGVYALLLGSGVHCRVSRNLQT